MVGALGSRVHGERDAGEDVADLGFVLDAERVGAVVEPDLGGAQPRAQDQVVDVAVPDHRDAGEPGGDAEAGDFAELAPVPPRQGRGAEDHQQRRPDHLPDHEPEHVGLGLESEHSERHGGHRGDEHRGDLDQADSPEVEAALEHRQRHDPDRRDHERRREQLEEVRGLLSEERSGHHRRKDERRESQRHTDDQRQHRRRLNVSAIQHLALDEHAAGTLVGERERELADHDRDRDATKLVRRDQVGEEDARRERQALRRDPAERRPPQAAERRLLELAAGDRVVSGRIDAHLSHRMIRALARALARQPPPSASS
jgi:hypothetical protein